jgi:hypothetical protein
VNSPCWSSSPGAYCWPCSRSSDDAGHLFWALIDLGHGLLILPVISSCQPTQLN